MSKMWMKLILVMFAVTSIAQVNVTVSHDPILKNAMRLGINLPGPNDYGAENYARNMIPNPGFEPAYWGSVVTTKGAVNSNTLVSDYWSTTWNTGTIGWTAGKWDGANYELPLQNVTGKVVSFTHANNLYTFTLDKPVTVGWHDPLLLRMREKANGTEAHSGIQARYIKSPGNTWQSVGVMLFDALAKQGDTSAGMLRVLRGAHELRFWAKGPAVIKFSLSRYGSVNLFTKEFTLTPEWTEYSATFTPNDVYAAGASPMLRIEWVFKSGTGFLLDDMFLGVPASRLEVNKLSVWGANKEPYSLVLNDEFFPTTVVQQLRYFNPGIIRGWSGNHGDTLENMLALAALRGPREYRTRIGVAGQSISYSIPDLLYLCREVGALPWIVLPPTLTDDEMVLLGLWLKEHATDFSRVYVEFANEAWGSNNPSGDPFAGASFDGGAKLGQVAHKKFTAMGPVPNVIPVIGGQAAWAGQNDAIRAASSPAYLIPIAPYYGTLKERYATPEDMFYPLYAKPLEDISEIGKVYANRNVAGGVYEINFHTTGGAGGNKNIINSFVASQAGGLSLPLYCLTYAREYKWTAMCAFTLAQYSTGGVRMWGVQRDLMATGRTRPTGLALHLANSAINGDMVRVDITNSPTIEVAAGNGLAVKRTMPQVDAFAWRQGTVWFLALFNLSLTDSANIALNGVGSVNSCQVLYNTDPLANNEDMETVSITKTEWGGILPPHSLTVLSGIGPEKKFYDGGAEVVPYDENSASTILFLK